MYVKFGVKVIGFSVRRFVGIVWKREKRDGVLTDVDGVCVGVWKRGEGVWMRRRKLATTAAIH